MSIVLRSRILVGFLAFNREVWYHGDTMAHESATTRIQRVFEAHREFLLLLLLFTAFRLLALFLLRPGGFIYDYSDYYFFESFASFSDEGLYPFVHYWMEYPPLFPWMAVGAYRLGLHFPLWTDPRLAFYSLVGLELLPFEIGCLALIYLIARRVHSPRVALRCGWIYALLFVPLYTWTGWFDTMPLFFLLATLYLLLDRRALTAGIALGLGFMSKATPAVILPVGWAVLGPQATGHLPRWVKPTPHRTRFVAGFAATAALIAAPFLWINPGLLAASFRSMFGRSSWETVWALLDGYTGYGRLGGNRFDPHPTFATHPTSLPWLLITATFAAIFLALYLWDVDWQSPRRAIAFTGLTVCLFLLYSKGYSPQFLIWLLPFIVILLPNLRGVIYALLLSAANIVEWVFYFIVFPQEPGVLVAAILLRTILIGGLALEFAVRYAAGADSLARARRALILSVTAVSVVLPLVGFPHLARVYAESRVEANPYRTALETIQEQAAPGAALLFTDPQAYRQLYPFLWRRNELHVLRAGDDLADLTAGLQDVWLARGTTSLDAAAGDATQRWLEDHFSPTEEVKTPRLRLRSYRREGMQRE